MMELEIVKNYFYLSGLFDNLKTSICDEISQCDKCIEVDGITYVPVPEVHALVNGDDYEKDTTRS